MSKFQRPIFPTLSTFCLALVASGGLFVTTQAQKEKRDHLTEQEAVQVQEYQEIDKRVEVFIKAAERRLLVLANPNATQKKKDEETWGPLPQGTKLELLQDYKHILEEAEEKLDDWNNHGEKDKLLPKALNKFKEAATQHITQLRALQPQLTDKNEQSALVEAIEEAEIVTKASTN
ncbi:MAG: hypothetical protein J2P21_07600 [Chloracidobacterium sp.]|nr:hypothetical protein [Chloracidobacterium sp.]